MFGKVSLQCSTPFTITLFRNYNPSLRYNLTFVSGYFINISAAHLATCVPRPVTQTELVRLRVRYLL